MSLLILPDEVLLDIFDYLYFYEIIYSFYDLMPDNHRIHDLINNRLRSVNLSKLDLSFMTKSQFMFICRYIRSKEHLIEGIHSLTLSNDYTIGEIRLFSSQIPYERMINLKKLKLIRPALDEYNLLFRTTPSQLTHLILEDPECDDDNRIILIDEMNDLIELTINSSYSVQFRSEYSRVEKLIVNQFNLIDTIGFSTFFPNLHYLDITLVSMDIDFHEVHIPLLTVLKLRSYTVEHAVCEKFLSDLLQLRELYYSNEIECTQTFTFDGYQCQSLIERLPLLEKFEIDVNVFAADSTDICEITASFQNSFYLSKNWNILCETITNSNDYHIYSVPLPPATEFDITTDSLVSSAVLPVDDSYANVEYLRLNMTSNWPLVTRLFSNVKTLELLQLNHSTMIPAVSILAYLNKSLFLSKIRKLVIPSPCHFEDSLIRCLLQQSAPHIDTLDISCNQLLNLIKTNMLQAPLSIRILILRDDYLRSEDLNVFIEFFHSSLNCLSLYLENNNLLPNIIQEFLDRFHFLYGLHVLFNDPISMLIHVQLCQLIQARPQASAELRPISIRIWQK